MKRVTAFFSAILVALTLSGCATQQGQQGALLGGGVGAVAGAIIDGHNPWRGAIIGGGLGAILGGGLGDIAGQASRDAAYNHQPVRRRLNDDYYVESHPYYRDSRRPRCAQVQERVFDRHGRLVHEEWKTICP